MRRVAAVTAVLLATTGIWVGTAQAAPTTVLLLQDSSGIAADRLHDRLLVGGSGAARNGVLVLNPGGSTVVSLLPSSVISGVSVALTGHTAWAASSSDDALYEINLDNVTTAPRTFHLLPGDDPFSVTSVTDRYVAFSGPTGVGVLDSQSGTEKRLPLVGGAVLRAIPYSTRLVATYGGGAAVIDVAGGTPRQVGPMHPLAGCVQANAEAVSPDGQSLAVVCATPVDAGFTVSLREYRLSDFTPATSYPIPDQPYSYSTANAVAYSLDGNYVALGELTFFGKDVFLLHRTGGHFSGVYSTDLGIDSGTSTDGLTFSGDGTRLQTLEELTGAVHAPDSLYLVSLPGAPAAIPVPAAVLSVTSPPAAHVGDSVTVTGRLTFANSPAPGAGQRITITRTLAGHTTSVSEATDADGRFAFVNTPTTDGVATYTVLRDADSLHTSGSATTTTVVTKRPTRLGLTAVYAFDPIVGTFTYTVHLGPTWSNRIVDLTVNSKPVAHGPVDAAGDLVAAYPDQCPNQPPGCPQLAEATFAGDARSAPAVVDLDLTNYSYF